MKVSMLKTGCLAFLFSAALPAMAAQNESLDWDDADQVEDEVAVSMEMYGDQMTPANNDDDDNDPALVEHRGRLQRIKAKVKKTCEAVKASDDQKSAIKDAFSDYKQEALPLRAKVIVARLKYAKNAASPEGTASAAADVAKEGVVAATGLMVAKYKLSDKVLFDVLKADQRKAGLKCGVAIKTYVKIKWALKKARAMSRRHD